MKKLTNDYGTQYQIRREKGEGRGVNFNEKIFIKKQEAVLPILFFYGIVILLGLSFPICPIFSLSRIFFLYYLVLS
ncbi:MAG: hypothetical protein CM1200mP1_15120 [Candidatus Neomarinimicrobiota bacterium]|nr:MAG: hypothetical protein CM1200mP1_15120 [Candidatus Neomarinimicrobiota bacterium]